MAEARNRYETAFESELPERPHKTLDYETPAERFNQRKSHTQGSSAKQKSATGKVSNTSNGNQLMKRCAAVLSVAIFAALMIGCSAFYESAGIPTTDLSGLYMGISRDDAEKVLGPPESGPIPSEDGFVANYVFDRGYRPPGDSRVGRSVAYEAADIVTLGSYSLGTVAAQKSLLRVQYNTKWKIIRAAETMREDCSVHGGNWPGEMCEKVQDNLYPSTLPASLSLPQ